MTACVSGESGVPSEGADYVGGSTIHLTADTNSSVIKDDHSVITTQQEDNGRSGEPSDNMNVDGNAEYVHVVKDNTVIFNALYCMWASTISGIVRIDNIYYHISKTCAATNYSNQDHTC